MTRIVIYVHNEEMAALKPLQARLAKQGALVTFSALKYLEAQKADQVLTTKRHLDTVRGIFAGTGIPVTVIEDEGSPAPAAPAPAAPAPAAPAPEPTEGVTLVIPEPDVEELAVEAEPEVAPAIDSDEVVITVSEQPAPAPISRRSRAR